MTSRRKQKTQRRVDGASAFFSPCFNPPERSSPAAAGLSSPPSTRPPAFLEACWRCSLACCSAPGLLAARCNHNHNNIISNTTLYLLRRLGSLQDNSTANKQTHLMRWRIRSPQQPLATTTPCPVRKARLHLHCIQQSIRSHSVSDGGIFISFSSPFFFFRTPS